MHLSLPVWQKRRGWDEQEPWGRVGGSKLVFLEVLKLPSKVSPVSSENGPISVGGNRNICLVLSWGVYVTFSHLTCR